MRHFFLAALLLILTIEATALDWFAVQGREVAVAKCLQLSPPSESEMWNYLNSTFADRDARVNGSFGQIKFADEVPELIKYFFDIHMNYMDRYRHLENQKILKVGSCDKVLCVLEKNYGKKEALQMLYVQAKFGFTTSPAGSMKPENYQNWTASELNTILTVLESVPPSFFPVKDYHILRFLKGYTLKAYEDKRKQNVQVLANARVDIFDGWFEQDQFLKISTMLHEMGHVIGSILKLDNSPEWVRLAKTNNVSKYAQTNAAEDFAETFISYRLTPEKLKRVSIAKYNYFKEQVFNGVEFHTQQACQKVYADFDAKVSKKNLDYHTAATWAVNNQPQISQEVTRQQNIYPMEIKAVEKCVGLYLSEFANRQNREATLNCIEKVTTQRAAQVEMISQNIVDMPVNSGKLKKISVSREYKNLIRERLRNTVIKELERIYEQSFLTRSSGSRVGYEVQGFRDEASFLIPGNKDSLQLIYEKVAAERDATNWSLMPFWSPNFNKLMP